MCVCACMHACVLACDFPLFVCRHDDSHQSHVLSGQTSSCLLINSSLVQSSAISLSTFTYSFVCKPMGNDIFDMQNALSVVQSRAGYCPLYYANLLSVHPNWSVLVQHHPKSDVVVTKTQHWITSCFRQVHCYDRCTLCPIVPIKSGPQNK